MLRAKIGGEDDHRVAEIDRAALSVGQAPIVKHLQQHVENVMVRLLHFVEQDDLVGTTTHGFGQRAAFVVADITGRGPDQARHRMFLHEFRHIDADHRVVVIKQKRGKCFGQFGLAHARRPQEEE